jgi:acylpyruvate hydrolase
MKFASYRSGNEARLAVVDGDHLIDLNRLDATIPADARQALLRRRGPARGGPPRPGKRPADARQPLAGVALAPVVPAPGKTVCLGLNYYDHAAESGRDKPVYPWFFLRPTPRCWHMAKHRRGRACRKNSTMKPNWRS